MTTKERLTRARILLLLDQPFWGTLALRMPLEEDPEVETLATNGVRVRYNPEFIDTLSDPEVQAVLAHEVAHVAHGHCWRKGNREHEAWNEAADYAINSVLTQAGFHLPKGALLDPALTGSAEAIYEKRTRQNAQQGAQPTCATGSGQGRGQKPTQGQELGKKETPGTRTQDGAKNPAGPEQPSGSGSDKGFEVPDPGRCGAVEDPPSEGCTADLEAEWKVAVVQAAMAAGSQGFIPGDLRRMIDEIVNPKVPWTTILRDFVERSARNDYNWSRPNRRYIQQGFMLPSLISEELPEVVIAIDTSGSIRQADLDQFSAEVSAVLSAYETTIRLVWCDARVHKTETLTRADLPLNLKPCGGGGTDFRPVFNWVEQEGLTPACLIYLTDMYGTFPQWEPDYPVLWVRTTEVKAPPWGEAVDLK